MAKLALSVPEKHMLRIARDTLKMTPQMAMVMGGPSPAEAREIIKRLTARQYGRNPIHQELDQTIHQAMAVGRKFKRLGYNKRRRTVRHRRRNFTRGRHQIKRTGKQYERYRRAHRPLQKRLRKYRLRKLKTLKYLKKLRARAKNATRPTPYKWFVKMYGIKAGARFYRQHRAKKHHWRR